MTGADVESVVQALFNAAGTRSFDVCLSEFERQDETACNLLFTLPEPPTDVVRDRPHPRAVYEDLEEAVWVAARRWPDRFLHVVSSNPALADRPDVLGAAGGVDRPGTRDLLVDSIRDRRAGRGPARGVALQSLVRLGDPRLPDLLVTLVKDPSSIVRGLAIEASISHGDSRLLPLLRRHVERSHAPWHEYTRELAIDAIEAIEAIEDRTDRNPATDQRRLVSIPLPRAGTDDVTVLEVHRRAAQRVSAGDLVAVLRVSGRRRRVTAPCAGLIVAMNLSPGAQPPPIMLWIRREPAHGLAR